MSENRAITVVSERPPLAPRALAGGILGADLGLLVFALSNISDGSGVLLILVILIPSIGLGGIVALVAYIIQQRQGSLSRLSRDLGNINSLMERRLINEEDYLMLKQRIINDYHPQHMDVPSVVKPALWTALATSVILLTMAGASIWAPVQAFFASIILPGIGGATLGIVGTNIAYRLQLHRPAPELPAGEPAEWQALGTRQSLPAKK